MMIIFSEFLNCCVFPVSTYKSQCFKEFYDFILGHGLDSSGLNRMGLKKEGYEE